MGKRHPGRVHRPSGPLWDAKRARLIAGWFRQGRPVPGFAPLPLPPATCYYCGHKIAAPNLTEVAHLIPWDVRLDLAEDPRNLVPAHGSGRGGIRRCPTCGLFCNNLSDKAHLAPKDPITGADLPFTDEFIARQSAKLKGSRPTPARVRQSPVAPFSAEIGREWLIKFEQTICTRPGSVQKSTWSRSVKPWSHPFIFG